MAWTDSESVDNHSPRPILGSGEFLSPEETNARLQTLRDWGVDLSLIQASLDLTPTERLQRMIDFLAVGEELHRSYLRLDQDE